MLTRGATVAMAILCAGCYRVDEPAEWACSVAEPQCPEGRECDGQRCRIPSCRSFETEWSCVQPGLGGMAVATCGSRKITCTLRNPLDPWLCTCQNPEGKVSDCGKAANVFGCWVAGDLFNRGCCKP